MRDIPVFDTEHGVASLVLREIPYKKLAYIRILDTLEPAALLEECIAFCRACGAAHIHAAGHDFLEKYPPVTTVVQMQRCREGLAEAAACLFPVTEETLSIWTEHYNRRMADVSNAAYMDSGLAKEMLQKGDGYFVHGHGQLLGLGRASQDTLDAVISLQPGAGEAVLKTLASLLTGDTVKLQVADNNVPAVRLYERLGFVKTARISRWYCVL